MTTIALPYLPAKRENTVGGVGVLMTRKGDHSVEYTMYTSFISVLKHVLEVLS